MKKLGTEVPSPLTVPLINEAAAWLASTPAANRPHPIVPHLCEHFALTTKEACAAIRKADALRRRAH